MTHHLPRPSSATIRRAGTYLAAGIGAVAGTLVVEGTDGFIVTRIVPDLLTLVPDVIVVWGILNLASLAMPLLIVTTGLLVVIVFATTAAGGVLCGRRFGGSTGVAAFLVLVGQSIVAYPLTSSLSAAIAAGVVGAVVVGLAGEPMTTTDEGPERRRVLTAIAGALGLLAIGAVADRDSGGPPEVDAVEDEQVLDLLDVADQRSFDLPGIEPLVSSSFYTVDINPTTPRIDSDDWRLTVSGLVDRELTVTYDDLVSRPAEHRFITLRCVSDTVNGDLMDTALWTGIPMATLLDEAGSPRDCCVRLEAADDYFQAFPRSFLDSGFLAWRMNGRPLPAEHGFPARVLIPGHWGEINVKWVTDIRVLDEPDVGYWERRGWEGTGEVETVAKLQSMDRIDDGRIRIGGHAYAGTRGIDRVEVSRDVGQTWTVADLSEPLPGAVSADWEAAPSGSAADAWRMWSFTYEASDPHLAIVRAVDGTGAVQPQEETGPFPSGATGWVRRNIRPESL